MAAIDFMLVPCGSKVTLYDGSEIGGGNECIYSPEGMVEYMSPQYNMLKLYNQMEIDSGSYDGNRIQRFSVIDSQYT